jgi:Ca2+-binding RTX toxin-like protein
MGWRALLLAVVMVAVQAPAAFAGTASVVGGTLTYAAAPGEVNQFVISYRDSDGSYTIGDVAAVAGSGCSNEDYGGIVCPGAAVTAVAIDLGDGADTGSAGPVPVPLVMHGGPGDDQLDGVGTLIGDDGNDYLLGREGHATLTGGPGLDQIEAQRDDTIDCQGGEDDVVKPFAKPELENCPAAPGLKVTTNHVSVKQFLAGKLRITIHCSIRCAYRFFLIAPPALKRYVHHGGGNIEARPITLDDAGFLKLGPTTQKTTAFVNGASTAHALSRLHRFRVNLKVQAYTGQNLATTQTISVQVG